MATDKQAEIRRATLKQLRATRKDMLSTRWTIRLETATDEEKSEYARMLGNVQLALLELQNKQMADIRDKIAAHEKAISDGIAALEKSLKTVEKISKAVKAVGQFLQVLGRVAKLVATA
jgi:ribosomal protein L20